MGDSINEEYDVHSADIQLSYGADPTISPSDHSTLSPSNNPTIFPSNNPTLSPTSNPTLFPFDLSTTTNSNNFSNSTDDRHLLIIITLQYHFSNMDIYAIISILRDFINSFSTLTSDECKQWINQIVTETQRATIINATVFLCDDRLTPKEVLLAVSDEDNHLQKDIITKVNEQISIQIQANKTSIDIQSNNNFDRNVPQTTFYVVPRENDTWSLYGSFGEHSLYWITGGIIIIAMTFCSAVSLLYIKYKTENKNEIKNDLSSRVQNVNSLSQISNNDMFGLVQQQDKGHKVASVSLHSVVQITGDHSYKPRRYKMPRNVQMVSSPKSESATSPKIKNYKTRHLSEDFYENGPDVITKQQQQQTEDHDDLYSRPNNNPELSPTSNATTTPSPRFQLPKHQITKRQWM